MSRLNFVYMATGESLVCMCVCVRRRSDACICVYVCMRTEANRCVDMCVCVCAHGGEKMCVCTCARRQNDGCVCVYVCIGSRNHLFKSRNQFLTHFQSLGGSSGRPKTAIMDLVSSHFGAWASPGRFGGPKPFVFTCFWHLRARNVVFSMFCAPPGSKTGFLQPCVYIYIYIYIYLLFF